MKALILAAGKGTRIRPLSYAMPKPMLPILNQPVLEILVRHLGRYGFDQIMVNTSYLSNQIEDYFRDGSRFGVQMAYSYEGYLEGDELFDDPLGSAGAIQKIQDHSGFFDDTFLVICGDAVVDIDLGKFLSFHKDRSAIASIALTHVEWEQAPNYGVVVTDPQGRVNEFQEKPDLDIAKSNCVNTGIYLFEPDIMNHIPKQHTYDIGGQLFPSLVDNDIPIFGAMIPYQWLDIGNITDYYNVIQMALKGGINGFSMPGAKTKNGIWKGLNVRGDLDKCKIAPPVYIAGSATIEPGCELIGPVMIGAGCIVESGAIVDQSIIFNYTRIGSDANVSKKMICGNYCVDANGGVVDLSKSDISWVIDDARNIDHHITGDQNDLINMLKHFQKDILEKDHE